MTQAGATERYQPENDPQMMRYWMQEGPKTAAFLLVIPGCTAIGFGVGMLLANLIPYSVIGAGAGCVLWGLVVVLRK